MRLGQHIAAKDFRRARWLLLAWLLAVAARAALSAAASELAFDDFGREIALANVSDLLIFVDGLVLVLLVSWLVHDEPLLGADAFWLTRPIRPLLLMSAKLAFAATFFIAAPLLAQSIVVAAALGSPDHGIRLLPGLFLSQSLWVAALIVTAALTPSLTRFLLALVAGAAAIAFAISAAMVLMLMTMSVDETSYPAPGLSDPTTSIVGSWLLLAVALIVTGLQYRTRRARLAVAAGTAGVVASAFITNMWPWPFARPAEPDPGAWARDPQVAAVLDAGQPHVADQRALRRAAPPKKQVALPIRLTGVPPQYEIRSMGMRSRLDLETGRAVQSAQGGMVSVRREGREAQLPSHLAPLQAAMQQTRLLAPLEEAAAAHWPVVLTLSGDEYERSRDIPGRLTTTVEAFLQESRLIGSIPLVNRATLQGPSVRFELLRVLWRPAGCSVLVREIRTDLLRGDVQRSYRFLLRNVRRGEAIVGDSEQMVRGGPWFRGLFFGSWSIDSSAGSGFGFLDHTERFPGQSPLSTTGPLDADWFAGTELAVIQTAYAGRVSRSLVVENFKMGS